MAITLRDNPADDTQTDLAPGRNRERDDFQKGVDETVKGLVGTDNTYRYTVAKDDKGDMKRIVRRATDIHKQTPVWFKDSAHEDGTVTIKFRVQPKPVKAEGNGQADQPAETPAETPPAEQDQPRGRFAGRR
jgi:hypothetical protein